MNKKKIKKIIISLLFGTILFLSACETTNSTKTKLKKSANQKTEIAQMSLAFKNIYSFKGKKVNSFVAKFGNFDLTKIEEKLTFQRLDKNNCRIFVRSLNSTSRIENILIFHAKRKKFYPDFNLKECII